MANHQKKERKNDMYGVNGAQHTHGAVFVEMKLFGADVEGLLAHGVP